MGGGTPFDPRDNLTNEYCPTDVMLGDFMTRPTQRNKLMTFWKEIHEFTRLTMERYIRVTSDNKRTRRTKNENGRKSKNG